MLTVVPESAARRHAQALDLKVLAVPWVQGEAGVVLAVPRVGAGQSGGGGAAREFHAAARGGPGWKVASIETASVEVAPIAPV